MTTIQAVESSDVRLRVWPGVAIVMLQLLLWLAIPLLPGGGMVAVLGGVACAAAIAIWWLLFSRAPWLERVAVVLLAAGGIYATAWLVDRFCFERHDGDDASLHGHAGGRIRDRSVDSDWQPVVERRSPRGARRRHHRRMRTADNGSHGRHLRRGQLGSPLAVDSDSRRAPSGRSTRRSHADCAGSCVSGRSKGTSPGRRAECVRNARLSSSACGNSREARDRARVAPAGGSCAACRPDRRVARLPRSRTRQRDSRRAHRNRLVEVPARGIVAPPDWTRLVVIRRQRRPYLHAGTARRRRDCRRVQEE